MTTYQKQKKLIAELTEEIVALVENKDDNKTRLIRTKWMHKLNVDKAMMSGSASDNNSSTIGLRNIIKS